MEQRSCGIGRPGAAGVASKTTVSRASQGAEPPKKASYPPSRRRRSVAARSLIPGRRAVPMGGGWATKLISFTATSHVSSVRQRG